MAFRGQVLALPQLGIGVRADQPVGRPCAGRCQQQGHQKHRPDEGGSLVLRLALREVQLQGEDRPRDGGHATRDQPQKT